MSRGNGDDEGESLLIQRIKKGEEYAFEIAFLKYHTPLCRYVWKYVRSEELSKGIVQEVFADVWEGRKNLDPSGHLRGYLFQVARNKALDHIKHSKVVDSYISEAKKHKEALFYRSIQQDESENRDLHDSIKESINDLPPRGRQIFKLNREEGLTYKEIAEYLEISIKTVEAHMRKVFIALRKHLSKYVTSFWLAFVFGVVPYFV